MPWHGYYGSLQISQAGGLMTDSNEKVLIKVGYAQLQECASICTACIMATNLRIFEVMVKRWAVDWRRMDFWDINKENDYSNTYEF